MDGSIFPGGDNLYEGHLEDVPGRARTLEAQGWDGAFTLDTNVDPFAALLLAAEHTSRLDLLTGVAIAFARSPAITALQAWNLQRFSKGRLVLGLGSQVQAHIEKRFGMPWSRPAARMREYVLALRAFWDCWGRRTPLDFRGEFYHHTLMTPVFDPGPIDAPDPKIHLGALGPRMVAVAGEVADGLYVHPFTTPEFVERVQRPALEAGLARSGRRAEDFEISCMLITITGRDEDELSAADFAMRKLLTFYASTPAYRTVLDVHGWGDLQPRLNRMSKEGRWDEMADLASEDMIRAFAVKGRPEEIPDLVAERCGGWVDRLTLYAPYRSAPQLWPPIVRGIQSREVAA